MNTEKPLNSSAEKLLTAYNHMVDSGSIERDRAQVALVERLDNLLEQISTKRLSSKSSALGWLFGQKSPPRPIRGLYIWGSVGRGKSMLMDMFFERVPHKRKRRSHFNDFMQDAQERIHHYRNAGSAADDNGEKDPIVAVGREMAKEARILCFDEFTVTDIADAMILGRLFQVLFREGVVIVATSNVEPQNLYRDGLNRKLFLPFIDLLIENVEICQLDARTDFRLEKLTQAAVYHHPLNAETATSMQKVWLRMTGVETGRPHEIAFKGRRLVIPEFVSGVARMGFTELCEEARSAEDYLALARQVHTLFLTDVSQINPENRNVAKRFILLIDTLYDNHVRLLVSAAVAADEIYVAKEGTEAFEFNRTKSRLHEMQSEEYLGSST